MATNSKFGFKDLLTTFFSLVALFASYLSYQHSQNTSLDVAGADAIKTEYQIFKDLARTELDHPHLVHLFAVTVSTYHSLSGQVAAEVAKADAQTRARYLLEERGMADYIFTAFEETYYHWDHARKVGDQDRATLLKGDLGYFQTLLCNPRLAWYWDRKGGKLGIAYGDEVQNYYKESVGKNCLVEDVDPQGPF